MSFAIIPAAGHSARMGRPKLLLPVAGRTLLERVIDSLRNGGIDQVVVVVAPHVQNLIPIATAAEADVCALATPTPDMRSTVEHGVRWAEEKYAPRPDDAWLLAPADHPVISSDVIREMLAEF